MAKVLTAVLAVVVLLFAVTIGLGQRDRDSSQRDPENSFFADLRERLVGDRPLRAKDVEGASCFDPAGSRFVVNAGSTCDVPVPGKVRRVVLDRQSPGRALVRLASDTGTQRADQDEQRVELKVLERGSILKMACLGPGACRLGLP